MRPAIILVEKKVGSLVNVVEGIRFENYKYLKTMNPKFPILIGECSGVDPQLWARYSNTTH
ncbi:hypothetical protein ZOSMA_164G00310 [Zostera marina]|uniref:Ribosomal protein/NADH dehydrogenase domain-containing protein n=1 Tax=Zostera marina TaxID=29655 RepID=A0A0K9PU14_ZOSMR|nr:hypothetical protein ZOSMA_164G00310 [Zostera marina]